MKLQLNTNGAWKHVVDFPAERRDEVLHATIVFARVLGSSTKWSFVRDDGKREWLGTLTDAVEATAKE